MACPPERITVKRRRDEDPVEALFIQQKKQRPSAIWKLVENADDIPQFLIPTASLDAVKELQSTTTPYNASKPPTVRITLPGEDSNKTQISSSRSSETTKPTADASAMVMKRQLPPEGTQAHLSRQNANDVFASALKARKFHLVNGSSSIPSPFLLPKTIAQKHRDKRSRDLAVFIETTESIRKAKRPGNVSKHSSGNSQTSESHNAEDMSRLEKPRKRPNATAAERKWRTETWANHPKPDEANRTSTRTAENIHEPSNQWNYESISLAEQLQAVALEEICDNEQGAKGLACSGKVKIKPKPPKARQPRAEHLATDYCGDRIMTDTIHLDEDCGYVLDTYVRLSAQPFDLTDQANLHHDKLHGVNQDKIGVLIVEDEEEALWESFADDQESDPEWNSEDEDENAEDYHGNDYPEDELASDDEFDRGAYNYRHAASDDEEFGPSDGE